MRQPAGARAGFGLAIFSSAAFSTAGALGKSLIDVGWSPAAAVSVRVAVAAAVLAIPAVVLMRGQWHVLRLNAARVIAYGLLSVAGAQLCYFQAIRLMPVGVALLIEYLGIVGVVGWMWARHGQRPRRLTLAGSAAALAGLALVLGVFGHATLNVAGVAWALGAALGLGSFFVLSSGSSAEDLPPVTLASAGMGVGALALLGLGGAGALPMHATFGSVTFAGHAVSWLVPVLGLSLVAAVLAYVTAIYGIRLLGPRLASFTGLTEVLFAVLVAWLLLGELPTLMQLGGGVLIIAGIAAVRADETRNPVAAAAAPAGTGGREPEPAGA